jgi:hypothetical protein
LKLILTSWKCNPLDCERRGSDNAIGEHPFIASMKTKFFKSAVLENKQRGAMTCLLFLCLISSGLASATVQLSNPKRITAMQVGSAAEGARVTIVSDSALSDYEAFRRGDRFYVKIPSAEFTSAVPQLRADGFENVQGQRVGDNVVVSFKLQPGASARVDQRSNRLDVVFSAPGRNPLNSASAASARGLADAPRTSFDRGANAAGPFPRGSATIFHDWAIAEGSRTTTGRRASKNSLSNNLPVDGNSQSTASNGAANPASPVLLPSSIPAPTSYTSSPNATPAGLASSNPAASSTGNGFLDWKARRRSALQWVSANRFATLLGGLIVSSLILFLATVVHSRRVGGDDGLPKTTPSELAKKPSIALASVAADFKNRMLSKRSITSPTARLGEHEEEEREVFEL